VSAVRAVTLRNETQAAQRCAAPDCASILDRTGTGRPARFCSTACRVRSHRDERRATDLPVTVEVDTGSASSRGRPPDRSWLVRLRRGDRSVIVAIGLRRTGAESLAEKISELLENPGS